MTLRAVSSGVQTSDYDGLSRSILSEQNLRERASGTMDRFNREALRLATQFGDLDHQTVKGFFPFSAPTINRLKELFDDEERHRARLDTITRFGASLFYIRSASADIHILSKMSDAEFSRRYDQVLGKEDVIGRPDEYTENKASYFARHIYQLNVEYLRATTDAARQFPAFGVALSGLESDDIEQISLLPPDVFHRLAQMLLYGYKLRLPEKFFERALNCPEKELHNVSLRIIAAITTNRRH